MRRLLFVSNLFPLPWQPGRGVFNLQQIQHLSAHVEILVLVPVPWYVWWRRPRHERQPYELAPNIRVITFAHWYLPRILRRSYAWLEYLSMLFVLPAIRRFRPDAMVGSWLYPDGVAAAKLARRLDLPLVLKAHGSDVNMHCLVPARAKQVAGAAASARALYTVSNALGQVLAECGVDTRHQVTLYNGIDLARFQPGDRQAARRSLSLDPEHRLLLFVGNVIESKGVLELTEALAALKDPAVRLVVIGDGGALEKVRASAANLGVADRVMIQGRLPHEQLASWIVAADALVLPSHAEGVPNVVLEAMACGRPVVATRVGGIPEVMPEIAGKLVPVSDTAALQAALEQVLASSWDEDAIRLHAEQFTWQKNVNGLLGLFGWDTPDIESGQTDHGS